MADLSAARRARRRELDHALEALHFGFRAIVAGPDAALAQRGLSRVHHRILYFIGRTPGLRVSELHATLGVTKQALHGPLRALTSRGLVAERPGATDRRSKHLALTAPGRDLEARLSGAQRDQFARVFRKLGKAKEQAWHDVMRLLAGDDARASHEHRPAAARSRTR